MKQTQACSPLFVRSQIYNYAGAGEWREDAGWVAKLGEGWDLQRVRDAAYAALAEVSGPQGVIRTALSVVWGAGTCSACAMLHMHMLHMRR